MKALVLVVALMAGCTTKVWAPIAATSLAMSATGCDWYQTHQTSMTRSDRWEQNPLLGPTPTPDGVDGYFGQVMATEATTGAILTAMPTKIRWAGIVAMLLVAGYEVELARENVNVGTPRCY